MKDSSTQTIESKISIFEYFHISDLTYYELFDTIWKTVQRNDISIENGNNIMNIHSFKEIVKGAFSLSVKMGITVYDASYVFLAMTLSIPLITSDKKLIN